MANDWPYKTIAIKEDIHADIRMTAAKEGVRIREVAERAFRLGLDAGRWQQSAAELAGALADICNLTDDGNEVPTFSGMRRGVFKIARTALAAYDAAQSQEETPR